MRKESSVEILAYAIGTEVDAVGMYLFIVKRLHGKSRRIVAHILKEEIEHISELLEVLSLEINHG